MHVRPGSGRAERRLAETLRTEEALAAIPRLAADLGSDPEVASWLRREYEKAPAHPARGRGGADDEPALRYDQHYTAPRLPRPERKSVMVSCPR